MIQLQPFIASSKSWFASAALLLLLLPSLYPQVDAFSVLPVPSTSTTLSTTTSLFLSNNSNDNDNDDDSFMKSLQSRMAQVTSSDSILPIVVLDAMLPRQVLKIEVENDVFQSLVKHCIERERLRFGMIGTATLAGTGQTWPLQNGVEVEIVDPPTVVDGTPGGEFSDSSSSSNGKALRVKLRAGRRFRIQSNELTTNPAGWTEARVDFLNPELEPEDAESMATAKLVARQILAKGFIDQWIALARTKEHFEGQIDQLLDDLGKMPSAEDPTELAFWIGALINPLPGMGQAMEIRPQLLMAKTAQERIGTVYSAIEASIHHMDGTKPLF